jgi:hypothetical protein
MSARQRWEYTTLTGTAAEIRSEFANRLNRHGQDGWELVAVVGEENSHVAYLRRPTSTG